MLARTLLGSGDEPFALLLSALHHDRQGLGSTREARRRRYGIGVLQSRRWLPAAARLAENSLSREARQRREQCYPPSARYALQRLMPDVHAPSTSFGAKTWSMAAVAVYATIGANGNGDDVVHQTGWPGTRTESRYVQDWIARHSACHVQDLITGLADAVDRARAETRGLVLPDLVPKPTAYPWADDAAR